MKTLSTTPIKELDTFFLGRGEVSGFTFKLIKHNISGYIYEVSDDNIIHYEVFKRKVNPRFNCVSYPKCKSFGVWAWSYQNYNKALTKFIDISITFIDEDEFFKYKK